MKARLFFLALLLHVFQSKAQDVHFTMFQAAPIILNPASAGMFTGNFRASTNFKTQWGAISSPYNTFSVTADGTLFRNKKENAFMGGGISLYRDVAGTSNFQTTKADLSISTILYLDANNSASIGFSGGFGQGSLEQNNLQWDSQFNGSVFDPALPSFENFSYNQNSYFDFSAGGMWSYGTAASNIASYDKFQIQLGAAYHHIALTERYSAYGLHDPLYPKVVVHGNMNFARRYSKLAIRPRFTVFFQGPAREFNIGTMFRYLVRDGAKYTGNVKGFAISAGGYYRIGDAFSPSIEIEYGGFSFGYCYDINISGLTPASHGLGGHELYLKFQTPNPFFKFSRNPRFH